jgi:iron complex transport system permease protein
MNTHTSVITPAVVARSGATDASARRRLALWVLAAVVAGLLAGLATGSAGFSPRAFWADLNGDDAALLIGQIRAPRTLGAVLVGALLGLAGAIAQGVFRNPLADPFLLGSAAGAGLGVVLVLAGASLAGAGISLATIAWIERVGLVAAAFCGALTGVCCWPAW